MSTLQVAGATIPVNAAGYLTNFDDWSEDVAREIAADDGLELIDCHWAAIHFLRQFYKSHGVAASPRVMIQEVGHKLNEHRCTYNDVKRLFPKGGIKQACRIAGLPDFYCHAC
jgi:tRNA 2-thiouridine synthesizing protein E